MNGATAIGLLAGVLAALAAWAEGWRATPGWLAWALAVACVLLAARLRWRPVAGLCAGLLLAGFALHDYDLGLLPPAFDERVLVEARVVGIPERRGAIERFTARLSPLRPGSGPRAGMLASLRWEDAPPVHAGETWQLLVGLHAPPVAANPGSGDTALLALRLRLQGAGQVVASPLNRRNAVRCCISTGCASASAPGSRGGSPSATRPRWRSRSASATRSACRSSNGASSTPWASLTSSRSRGCT